MLQSSPTQWGEGLFQSGHRDGDSERAHLPSFAFREEKEWEGESLFSDQR